MKVAIIGAGKVGSVLGKVLVDHGEVVTCVVSRSIASARRAGRFLHCSNVSDAITSIPSATDTILITTPHAAVENVAWQLSRVEHLEFRRLAVCHASGMLTSKALEPVRRRGAIVFSFHPLQTFPRDFKPRDIVASARGIFYGIDGDPRALQVARRLARALYGRTIVVPPEMRAFYHAACVVASNHLTALLSVLEQMSRILHLKEKDYYRVFRPIILATLKNVEVTSPARALSGPVARGGAETVAEHFASIKRFAPELLPYFSQLTMETVKLASAKGSINRSQKRALVEVVRAYRTTFPIIPEPQ